MSHVESALLRRVSGAQIVSGRMVLALSGFMPLPRSLWLGPRDGNPLGQQHVPGRCKTSGRPSHRLLSCDAQRWVSQPLHSLVSQGIIQ